MVSIGQRAGDERIDGLSTHKLKIGVTDYGEAPYDLPNTRNGVKVDVVEEETPTEEFCSTTCSCVKGGSELNVGTNGCTVEDSTYGLGIITCAH